jgi:hypothetical protein
MARLVPFPENGQNGKVQLIGTSEPAHISDLTLAQGEWKWICATLALDFESFPFYYPVESIKLHEHQ